jgi:hypothetical protein
VFVHGEQRLLVVCSRDLLQEALQLQGAAQAPDRNCVLTRMVLEMSRSFCVLTMVEICECLPRMKRVLSMDPPAAAPLWL